MGEMEIDTTDPTRLAELFQVSGGRETIWRPEDLGGILRHQLSMPLELSPTGGGGGAPAPAATFGELLRNPEPGLELLRLAKQFAKRHGSRPGSLLPREVALVLYYALIAAALLRCRKRITSLSESALRTGFSWTLKQAWLDDDTRGLVHAALATLPDGAHS